jgi:hypothetical protein
MKCYYDNELCDYEQGLWQCQTCKEWFCFAHSHTTEKGKNVECVACERARVEQENFEYELWTRASRMKGHGLRDYLEDFFDNTGFRSSYAGETVFYASDPEDPFTYKTIFNRWDIWKHCISDHFQPLLDAWKQAFGEVDEEKFMEVLVYRACEALGIFNKVPGNPQEPETWDKLGFMWFDGYMWAGAEGNWSNAQRA